jgi:hypothetical protein
MLLPWGQRYRLRAVESWLLRRVTVQRIAYFAIYDTAQIASSATLQASDRKRG